MSKSLEDDIIYIFRYFGKEPVRVYRGPTNPQNFFLQYETAYAEVWFSYISGILDVHNSVNSTRYHTILDALHRTFRPFKDFGGKKSNMYL